MALVEGRDDTTRDSEDSWNAVLTDAAASSCDDAHSALAGFKAAMADCGGSEEYLSQRVCHDDDLTSFNDFLCERFPRLETHQYKEQYPLTAQQLSQSKGRFMPAAAGSASMGTQEGLHELMQRW